jgi:hypothetical protein
MVDLAVIILLIYRLPKISLSCSQLTPFYFYIFAILLWTCCIAACLYNCFFYLLALAKLEQEKEQKQEQEQEEEQEQEQGTNNIISNNGLQRQPSIKKV